MAETEELVVDIPTLIGTSYNEAEVLREVNRAMSRAARGSYSLRKGYTVRMDDLDNTLATRRYVADVVRNA